MSDCDVCIGGGNDGDPAEFYNDAVVKARKPHKCCECGRVIAQGSSYQRVTAKWDGEFGHYNTCLVCKEIRDVFTCGEGFLFECLWEDMQEIAFERLTMSSECFRKLSPAAKQYVLDRWNKWKGIA